jgi:AcrR family transcriptional regulator
MSDAKVVEDPPLLSAHKQQRAMLTRDRLLRSARAVFARDGFEQARVEDIAALSGKTRGAFYDNFEDKEDVFYAIFESNTTRDLEQLGPLLSGLRTTRRRIEALADYLVDLSEDRERMLLNLEFKLYAIRHGVKRQRLAQLYTGMCLRSSLPELNRLLPQLGDDGRPIQAIDCFAISGILEGLALNHFFNPEILCKGELSRYLRLCLRELMAKPVECG